MRTVERRGSRASRSSITSSCDDRMTMIIDKMIFLLVRYFYSYVTGLVHIISCFYDTDALFIINIIVLRDSILYSVPFAVPACAAAGERHVHAQKTSTCARGAHLVPLQCPDHWKARHSWDASARLMPLPGSTAEPPTPSQLKVPAVPRPVA